MNNKKNTFMERVEKWATVTERLEERYRKRLVYVASALLPMTVILIAWIAMGMFPFGTKSLMAVDFGQQYISFYGLLKETVLSGDWSNFFYSFTKSIGGDMIGVLAYYLMSPFNLLYVIMPLEHFPWAVFLTIWLRYGAIGMSFAHLLVKRYRGLDNRPWLVPVFATTYALSGMLVSYQMNPIFYDAMIMLPLVIIALEELLDGGKPYRYMIVLALTMLLQFYMGYMICLFVALYALYYRAPYLAGAKGWKAKWKAYFAPLVATMCYSILGIGLIAFLLYPVVLNLLESKGQVGGGMQFAFALQINPLDILSKLMIGGFDTESGWSAGPNLPNIYVGALPLIAAPLYFKAKSIHRNLKIGASAILLVFFVSIVHEFTSKIWHMGQNPAGFFYRFSWIVSFFLVLLAFQAVKAKVAFTWKTVAVYLAGFAGIAFYVAKHTYTYIGKEQPLWFTEFVTRHSAALLICFLLVIGGSLYLVHKRTWQKKTHQLITMGALVGSLPMVLVLFQQKQLFSQLTLTLFAWGVALLVLYTKPKEVAWSLLTLLTVFELGYNAYLSQITLGYADAYKFSDAALSVKKVVNYIEKTSTAKFYRIGSNFSYSDTTPSLLGYNGLSTFSSSLERTTMDLFAYMGDVGVNAATRYANGTPLTDALYGVRYYIERKPHTAEDINNNPKKMYFVKNSSRQDIHKTYGNVIYEDDRYIAYENPNVFSIAFATNTAVQNIQFGLNNPAANQNIILTSMGRNDTKYFEAFSFTAIETENVKEKKAENGDLIYERVDKNQHGIIRYKVVPKSNYSYYFLTPALMNETRGNLSILLKGEWLYNQQNYSQKQLWPLTSDTEGQETVLEFRFMTDEANFTGAALIRANDDEILSTLSERQVQSMDVTEFTNTSVKGKIDITDDSNVMMTTIPYSTGWSAKVDGKPVVIQKAWNSLISFPITPGKHNIELTYTPRGFDSGLLISGLSLVCVLAMVWIDRKDAQKKSEDTGTTL